MVRIPENLIESLRTARHVAVLTGSGISAESGIPTFRDAQEGLWAEFDPQELATPEAFLANPETVWEWYKWRRQLVLECAPNAGHLALVSLSERVPEFSLVTQNVDGLHQRSGSSDVIEYHGNLFDDRCFVENCSVGNPDSSAKVPSCPACGGPLRPGVVWFGEAIPERARRLAEQAASSCDVFLSIGTSSMVWPAAGLAESAARNGALTVEINPNPTMSSGQFDFQLPHNAGRVLPLLIECLTQ